MLSPGGEISRVGVGHPATGCHSEGGQAVPGWLAPPGVKLSMDKINWDTCNINTIAENIKN